MSMTPQVIAICLSDKKGIQKSAVQSAQFIENYGIQGDAHSGDWHRQVSLLSEISVNKMKSAGLDIQPGAFGENLVVSNLEYERLFFGDELQIGKCVFQVTQQGKACTHGCAIKKLAGDCVMPREGIFLEVIVGGTIQVGDSVTHIPCNRREPLESCGLIVISDRSSKGERKDLCGPKLSQFLIENNLQVIQFQIVSDSPPEIEQIMRRMINQKLPLIITSGGTGVAPRDNTPEVTVKFVEKRLYGFETAMMIKALGITPNAVISRAVCGISGQTLIINLPGSPKAALENLEAVIKAIPHTLKKIAGDSEECGIQKT